MNCYMSNKILKFRKTESWRYSLDLVKSDWEIDIITSWLALWHVNIEYLEDLINDWFYIKALEFNDYNWPEDFLDKKTERRDWFIKWHLRDCLNEFWIFINWDDEYEDDWLGLDLSEFIEEEIQKEEMWENLYKHFSRKAKWMSNSELIKKYLEEEKEKEIFNEDFKTDNEAWFVLNSSNQIYFTDIEKLRTFINLICEVQEVRWSTSWYNTWTDSWNSIDFRFDDKDFDFSKKLNDLWVITRIKFLVSSSFVTISFYNKNNDFIREAFAIDAYNDWYYWTNFKIVIKLNWKEVVLSST